MGDERRASGFLGRLSNEAKAIGVIIGVAAAGLTLWSQWDKFVGERRHCTVSGTVFAARSTDPLRGVRIGYAPNYSGSYQAGFSPDFRTIAVFRG